MAINLFDINFYRTANPDLTKAGLTTDAQITSHFQNYGLNEGRLFSPIVNLNFYRASNPDLNAAGLKTNRQLLEHLQDYGVSEGRRFSPYFDTKFYLTANNDLKTAFSRTTRNDNIEAVEHLFGYGLNEGRQFSQFFDINYYRNFNGDLQGAKSQGMQLLEHFVLDGLKEGRGISYGFDINYYSAYSDLKTAGLSNQQLYEHFQLYGLSEGRASSNIFDVKYYLGSNADLRAANLSRTAAYDHFILYGLREGRSGANSLNSKWISQASSSIRLDLSEKVVVDSAGNIYITGKTEGSLPGYNNAGDHDAFVAKYNSSGTMQWVRQFGTSDYDSSNGVAVDSAGNVYITGNTEGSLGKTNAGSYDAWVAKYNTSGTRQWIQQLGTSKLDSSNGVAVDSAGNVYITGNTEGTIGVGGARDTDAWLAKYDTNGSTQWTRQLGTNLGDSSGGVAVDSTGNVYIGGTTWGSLSENKGGFKNVYIAKYNSTGTRLWTKQPAKSLDEFGGIAIDNADNIYITGSDRGSVLGGTWAGGWDAWVIKYSNSGTLEWSRQLGTGSQDYSNEVAVDNFGNVYITGSTEGSLQRSNAGLTDAWIAKYDSGGNKRLVKQLGTSGEDFSSDVAVSSDGTVYITGGTTGNFGPVNYGNYDAWLAQLR